MRVVKYFSMVLFIISIIILSACASSNANNSQSNSSLPLVALESNLDQEYDKQEPATSKEITNRTLIISYEQSGIELENKETQRIIDTINDFQKELTVAILEEVNIESSFEVLPNLNDIAASVSRGDSDAAFGYNSDVRDSNFDSEFDFSYSYLYAKIKFSSFDYKGHHVFIVKKGSSDILDILNEGINTIKNNGVYEKIYKKYFGDDDSMSIIRK